MSTIVLSYLKYPMAIGRYVEDAFRQTGHQIITACAYTGTRIPWMGGMDLPEKYAQPPDIELPLSPPGMSEADLAVREKFGAPDLWVQIDAGYYMAIQPKAPWYDRATYPVAVVASDPHVLNYSKQRVEADFFFNMQDIYCEPGDIWLPYAYSAQHHYPVEAEIEYDAMLIGLQYANRCAVMGALAERGYRTYLETGPVFDQARDLYAKTKVILNWSSLLDTVARVWEAMAFRKCLVTNRTPGLGPMFKEGEHYLGFGTVGEAVEKIEWALAHDKEREEIAHAGREEVTTKGHSYDDRVGFILERVGLDA